MQPAASAGPILRVAIAAGKFHGVTSTQMPTGCCSTRIRFAPDGAVMHRARPRAPPPRRTSGRTRPRRRPRRGRRAAPCRSPARSAGRARSRRAVISSNARRRISARSRGAVAAQRRGRARRPRRPRPARPRRVPSATVVITSPVAGSSTSNRPPSEAGTPLAADAAGRSGSSIAVVDESCGHPRSVGVGDDEVLGREEREDPRAVLGDDDLLLDPRGGEAVGWPGSRSPARRPCRPAARPAPSCCSAGR